MGFRDWATKKLSNTVEAVAEPLKQNVLEAKDAATSKTGLLANSLRVITCLIIGWILIRDDTHEPYAGTLPARQEPNHIIINNYIREKEDIK